MIIGALALIDGASSLQIDALPLSSDNALPDLLGRLLLFGHDVAVIKLLEAGSADCGMLAFIAAMKTLVAHRAIAIAIAGLLIDHFGNLRRQGERVSLHRFILGAGRDLDLIWGQKMAQNLSLGWRGGMVSRNVGRFAHPLRGTDYGKTDNAKH